MNKPEAIQGKPYYDLIDVLDYIDEKASGFKDKIWDILCDMGYINNDTVTNICFDGLISKDSPSEIVDGIGYLFEEFPDIKDGEVDFSISW